MIDAQTTARLNGIAQRFNLDPLFFQRSVALAHQFRAQTGRLPQPQEWGALHSQGLPGPAAQPSASLPGPAVTPAAPLPPQVPNALGSAAGVTLPPISRGAPTMTLQQLAALGRPRPQIPLPSAPMPTPQIQPSAPLPGPNIGTPHSGGMPLPAPERSVALAMPPTAFKGA